MAGEAIKRRRAHSVHHTRGEAVAAARNLAHLMNGCPVGYTFCVWPRMGKWAFISLPAEYSPS